MTSLKTLQPVGPSRERTAVVSEDETVLTYRELDERTNSRTPYDISGLWLQRTRHPSKGVVFSVPTWVELKRRSWRKETSMATGDVHTSKEGDRWVNKVEGNQRASNTACN